MMPEYCPRDKCVWTSRDGKCHWPTDNCPWKDEKERAAERVQLIEQAQAAARARERKRRHDEKQIKTAVTGLTQTYSGKWEVNISAKSNGRRREFYVGTYKTEEEATAARYEAERHRADGNLEKWLKSRKKG